MPLPRLALLLLTVPLLAACEGSQPPAPESEAGTAPAAAVTPASEPEPESDAMAPLFGTFAADLAWCDGDAGGDGFPVTISPTSFEGRENVCEIKGITQNGEDSFVASLTCTAEGQTIDERLELVPIFAPSGEGLRINYLDRGGATTTLLRCR
jgi:hypothetical protein